MPAAAVIPAPIAYINAVAVKTLVVEITLPYRKAADVVFCKRWFRLADVNKITSGLLAAVVVVRDNGRSFFKAYYLEKIRAPLKAA